MTRRGKLMRWIGAVTFLLSAAVATAEPPDSLSVTLTYQDSGFALSVPYSSTTRVNFTKEPEYKHRDVQRRIIPLSKSDKSQFIGMTLVNTGDFYDFSNDQPDNQLYIDHNRNLDLTDDPGNPIQGTKKDYFRIFEGVTISVERDNVTVPYCFDLFWDIEVRSGWVGKLQLGEREFFVGIADNFDGEIDGADLFHIMDAGTQDSPIEFREDRQDAMPKYLAVAGALYALSTEWQPQDAGPSALVLTLQKIKDNLHPVPLAGDKVDYLMLQGKKKIAVKGPLDSLALPEDTYHFQALRLEGGYTMDTYSSDLSVVVGKDRDVLSVGAPLNPTIDLNATGRSFVLSYELHGQAGELYDPPDDQEERPAWEVYKDGELLAQGHFEYG